jgi:hypothetical protein
LLSKTASNLLHILNEGRSGAIGDEGINVVVSNRGIDGAVGNEE